MSPAAAGIWSRDKSISHDDSIYDSIGCVQYPASGCGLAGPSSSGRGPRRAGCSACEQTQRCNCLSEIYDRLDFMSRKRCAAKQTAVRWEVAAWWCYTACMRGHSPVEHQGVGRQEPTRRCPAPHSPPAHPGSALRSHKSNAHSAALSEAQRRCPV